MPSACCCATRRWNGIRHRRWNKVYAFLQIPAFAHDYADVAGDAERFDAALQTPGLHRVRRTVGYVPRRSVLPPELFDRLQQLAVWETESVPGVRIV